MNLCDPTYGMVESTSIREAGEPRASRILPVTFRCGVNSACAPNAIHAKVSSRRPDIQFCLRNSFVVDTKAGRAGFPCSYAKLQLRTKLCRGVSKQIVKQLRACGPFLQSPRRRPDGRPADRTPTGGSTMSRASHRSRLPSVT